MIPNIYGNGIKTLLNDQASHDFIDLLSKMLQINPKERITAVDVLIHPFFDELR